MEAIAPSQAEQKCDINLPDKLGHNTGNFSVGHFQQSLQWIGKHIDIPALFPYQKRLQYFCI